MRKRHPALWASFMALATLAAEAFSAEGDMPVPTRWSWQETPAEVDAKGARIAHGTLADADTTIEELYAWEFDGPFLRDFAGSKPTGPCRAAGAIGRSP